MYSLRLCSPSISIEYTINQLITQRKTIMAVVKLVLYISFDLCSIFVPIYTHRGYFYSLTVFNCFSWLLAPFPFPRHNFRYSSTLIVIRHFLQRCVRSNIILSIKNTFCCYDHKLIFRFFSKYLIDNEFTNLLF